MPETRANGICCINNPQATRSAARTVNPAGPTAYTHTRPFCALTETRRPRRWAILSDLLCQNDTVTRPRVAAHLYQVAVSVGVSVVTDTPSIMHPRSSAPSWLYHWPVRLNKEINTELLRMDSAAASVVCVIRTGRCCIKCPALKPQPIRLSHARANRLLVPAEATGSLVTKSGERGYRGQ